MNSEKIYDIIIIGGGAAALTAAVYCARKKNDTIIIAEEVGGQATKTNDIQNWPGMLSVSGVQLIADMRKQAEKHNIGIFEGKKVVAIEKSDDAVFLSRTADGDVYRSRAVIIASGKKPRRLGVPGDEEFENKGLTYCPICDAPLFLGKPVAVIGGGNAGFEAALDLVKYATKIYVLDFSDTWRGDASTKEKLERSGKVEFISNAQVVKIFGGNFVEGIIYNDRTTNKERTVAVNGVFVEIGSVTNVDFAEGFVEMDQYKQIIIDNKKCSTSVEGVFAAGDVTDSVYKQIVIAAADGAKAALAADEYLNKSL